MYRAFLIRLIRVSLRTKQCFLIVNVKYFQQPYFLKHTMPPKRKAAPAKAEAADLLAGGDQPDSEPPKARRGRPKKETEEPIPEVKKGRPKRAVQEPEEAEAVEEPSTKKSAKKAVPAKETSKEKEKVIPEKKKGGRGKKAAEVEEQSESEDEIIDQKVTKRRGKKDETNGAAKEKVVRKKKADASPEEPKTKSKKKADKEDKPEKSAPMNSTVSKWDKINFACTKKNGEGQKANLKISCWNVGGLKSWVKKECLKFLEYEDPDILCMQETKCNEEKLPEEIKELKEYKQYWCSSKKEGYAGVGLLTKKEPLKVTYGINDPELDEDGRCITAEFDEYYLVCVYVPNAGRKLVTLPKRLDWNVAFKDYVQSLDEEKPVIICGDMNVAHNEIDIARPSTNTKSAGFTIEEREGMTDFLQDGYIDTFRKLYPDKADMYTYWTYMANARAKNIGWRLDYFIVSERIMNKVCDNVIRSEVLGSDHCPLTLFINM